MKYKKYIVDTLYRVRFYDHCIGKLDKMTCEIVGWLVKDEKEHIVLTPWIVDTQDKEIARDNIEPYSIIKSTIISSRKLL